MALRLAAGATGPTPAPSAEAFDAARLRQDAAPASPLLRRLLHVLCALVAAIAVWVYAGRLDIVAVADGRLVPRTRLKIVQPADGGVVREILVAEGAEVVGGEVLVRLDPALAQAELRALSGELAQRMLQLRRIDAELDEAPLVRHAGDDDDAFARADAQRHANRSAWHDAQGQEAAALARVERELAAATTQVEKLERTVPIHRTTAERYARLAAEGFVSELFALDRQREHIEREHDLAAQRHATAALTAQREQAARRLAQVTSAYRQQLHAERAGAAQQRARLAEELAKQHVRAEAVELRAPQAGIVKDLATHTVGTVVAPGAVLLTLVPAGDALEAEVAVANADAGFVRAGQPARVKIAAYPFQKYGLVDGTVVRVGPDAVEPAAARREAPAGGDAAVAGAFVARIALPAQSLVFDGAALPLAAGMQVAAEIRLGERSVLEYLLAPMQKAWHDAARER
jgi:hemolysin D